LDNKYLIQLMHGATMKFMAGKLLLECIFNLWQ